MTPPQHQAKAAAAEPRGSVIGAIVFGGLAIGLVLLLWLREGSAAQSVAHAGQLPWLDLRYGGSHTDRVLGVLTAVMGVGLVAAGALSRFSLARNRFATATARGLLIAMVLASGITWLYGARGVAKHHYVKVWDSFHYLLGSKYYEELGYFAFYDCVAAADAETAELLRGQRMRDLWDYGRRIRVKDAIKRGNCKERFTKERWETFKHDYLFYVSLAGRRVRAAVGDHGYNGTPTHALLSGLIANSFELDYRSCVFATLIDSLSLLAMFYALSVAFGWETAAVCAVLFFTCFPTVRPSFMARSFATTGWYSAASVSRCSGAVGTLWPVRPWRLRPH